MFILAKQEEEFIINALKTEFGKTCIKIRPKRLLDLHYVYITVRLRIFQSKWNY